MLASAGGQPFSTGGYRRLSVPTLCGVLGGGVENGFLCCLGPSWAPKARLYGPLGTSLSIITYVFPHCLRPSLGHHRPSPQVKAMSLHLERVVFSDHGGFSRGFCLPSLPVVFPGGVTEPLEKAIKALTPLTGKYRHTRQHSRDQLRSLWTLEANARASG